MHKTLMRLQFNTLSMSTCNAANKNVTLETDTSYGPIAFVSIKVEKLTFLGF